MRSAAPGRAPLSAALLAGALCAAGVAGAAAGPAATAPAASASAAARASSSAAARASSSAPARAAPSVYTLYAAGDVAQCGKYSARTARAAPTADLVARALAADPNAAAVVMGDAVYERGTARDFAQCYGPTWGRFKDRTLPAPGNREYATPGAAGYFGYFGRPAWYSVDAGSWHLISLDSNLDGPAQQRQLAWLAADLAAHPAKCTAAWWHHPLYSSGGHGSNDHMRAAWELLYRAGAELVLAGHDHDYERFAPQDADGHLDPARGIRQFVVGTGGAFTTPFLWPAAHSEVRDNDRTGVLKLRLLAGRYEWQFLEASYDGFSTTSYPDHGSASCH